MLASVFLLSFLTGVPRLAKNGTSDYQGRYALGWHLIVVRPFGTQLIVKPTEWSGAQALGRRKGDTFELVAKREATFTFSRDLEFRDLAQHPTATSRAIRCLLDPR